MPSKKEVDLFLLYSRFAANCYIFGIDIIPISGKLGPTKSKFKLIVHYLTLTWLICMSTISVSRSAMTSPQTSMYSENSEVAIALEAIYMLLAFGHCMATTWFVCFGLFREELVNLWNQLYQFCLNGNILILRCVYNGI